MNSVVDSKLGIAVHVRSLVDDPNAVKCPRCWMYHYTKMNFDGLCDKCCHVLLNDFPEHEAVPFIKASYWEQKAFYGRLYS